MDKTRSIEKMSFLKNRIHSFKNAFRGVFVFFTTYGGAHAKIHALASVIVLSMGFYFDINPTEWMAVSFAIGLVLIAEIINSAIEQMVDLLHPDWDEKAGAIKDMAAGGVLIAACVALVIGWLIFGNSILVSLGYLFGFHG